MLHMHVTGGISFVATSGKRAGAYPVDQGFQRAIDFHMSLPYLCMGCALACAGVGRCSNRHGSSERHDPL